MTTPSDKATIEKLKKLKSERASLKEKLEIAVEALEILKYTPKIQVINYEETNTWPAREALQKIK